MGVKPLNIHPAALQELKSVVIWYQERNQTAALNFVGERGRAIDLIVESPGRWPSRPHGTQRFVLQRFPFAIVYRERPTFVQVLAIAHGHRRPGYWKVGYRSCQRHAKPATVPASIPALPAWARL